MPDAPLLRRGGIVLKRRTAAWMMQRHKANVWVTLPRKDIGRPETAPEERPLAILLDGQFWRKICPSGPSARLR